MMPRSCAASSAFRDLRRNLQRVFERDRPTLQSIRERLAFDEFKDQEAESVGLFEIVDRGNVGMIQRGEKLGFTLEAADPVRVAGELSGKDLNGNVTFQLRIARSIDFAHAPGADQRHKLIIADLPANPGLTPAVAANSCAISRNAGFSRKLAACGLFGK